VIYGHPICPFLRDAVRNGRLTAWKPIAEDRWVLNIPGQPCHDNWTTDDVIAWLAGE
jgi:hypothetical protein